MKFIDLFCGCGGFSEGLRQAGHECLLAIDNWEVALKSHEANHPEAGHWNRDILTIKPQELPKTDFIVGSPPCPEFSTIGPGSGQHADTTQLKHFIKIGKMYDFFIGENVRNVKKHLNGLPYQILSANSFRGWHKRDRCFFGKFPKVRKITRNPAYFPTPCASPGGRNRMIQTNLKRRKYQDSCIDYPVHVSKWIMGFPESYELYGDKGEQFRQVGNAVDVRVAKAIGETLK